MMKRKKLAYTISSVITMMLVIATLFAVKTNKTNNKNPKYYSSGICTAHKVSNFDLVTSGQDKATTVTQQDKSMVIDVFKDISKIYDFEVEIPKIGYYQSYEAIIAQYNKGWIYINFEDRCVSELKAAISHEIMHYLSDCNDSKWFGFIYNINDTYLLGVGLNEGMANYLSTKYASNSVYKYETSVAKILAICFGEEKLTNSFFNANISDLRDDFDAAVSNVYKSKEISGLSLNPFDTFNGFLDTYGERTRDNQVRASQMLAIYEMLLYYAEAKGCRKEVRDEIINFATSNNCKYLLEILS